MRVLFLGLVFLVASSDKQSYLSDFKKIKAAYDSSKCLSFSVVYKSFDTSVSKPDTTFVGQFKVKGDKFYSKVANNETCQNGKYYLAIDHVNKVLVINKAIAISDALLKGKTIDSVLTNVAVKKAELNGGKSRLYTISYPGSAETPYKSFAIEIDTNTFFIRKIVIRLNSIDDVYEDEQIKYLPEPFVEMIYTNYNDAALADEVFDLDRYVTINGNEDVICKPKYKSYRVVNSLALTRQNH